MSSVLLLSDAFVVILADREFIFVIRSFY